MVVTIHYFPIRGRAEVLKLLCAAKGIDFVVKDVNYEQMKTDRQQYPFGQCPRLVDGDVDLCQSNAIVRHLARKNGMYGSSEADMGMVDMFMDGIEAESSCQYPRANKLGGFDESSGPKTGTNVHGLCASGGPYKGKSAYWQKHGSKESANARNKGAHFDYLEQLLVRIAGGNGFVVGGSLTAADVCVWEIVDLHLRIFRDQMESTYPILVAHHKRIAETPGIKDYLASPLRLEKINNNNLG